MKKNVFLISKLMASGQDDNGLGPFDDPDSYDDYGEPNSPFSPIWDGPPENNDSLDIESDIPGFTQD